ncbi:MAG: glutamate-5-semialdehyde dehydrogenase, partial [Gammaproteobacteria bacterium]|nr:glutamate-5-semialdehyde dehydrogenase [Gammaproteobacteria bacterium]
MQSIIQQLEKVKAASYGLCELSDEQRNQLLLALSAALIESLDSIVAENSKDLALMEESDPKYDRLLLTPARIKAIARDVEKVSQLPAVTDKVLMERKLDSGLHIQKVSVPLGVIGVIYESRPNVTIDVFSLCFKSGNACVLKGGKEAHHSNTILAEIIHQVLHAQGLNPDVVYLMPSERSATNTLLQAVGLIDICIPRGSQGLIDFVRDHARVPTLETGAGVVHAYFHSSADFSKGQRIIENAKTRRVSVCNALDSLVLDQRRLDELARLVAPLAEKNVEIFADSSSYQQLVNHYPGALLHHAKEEDFGREFLSYKMSIKVVADLHEAVAHIMRYTSGHSETIIAEEREAIDYFL